jgi:hypothetical protein
VPTSPIITVPGSVTARYAAPAYPEGQAGTLSCLP